MRRFSVITLVVLAILFIFGIVFYNKMGAFEDPEVKVITVPAYVVAGTPFKGKAATKEFGKLFNEADKLVEEKKLSGQVCGIFYTDPNHGNEETEAFVGVILSDTAQTLPEGYSKRYLPSRKVIQAHIANGIGSPVIYPKIEDYAKEHKISYKTIPALEIYPSPKEVFVQVPVDSAGN